VSRQLEEYDARIARMRSERKSRLERQRGQALQALSHLAAPQREQRERALRLQWWREDYLYDLDLYSSRKGLEKTVADIHAEGAQRRRRQEALTIADLEGAMRVYRGPLLGAGKTPVDVARRWHRLRLESGAPEIPALRADIDRLATQLGVTIRWNALPVNGYAWQTLREIEVSPVVSEEAYAVAGHELGHIAEPCQPTHTPRPRLSAVGSVCCACELAAWRWAARHLGQFTLAMHTELASSLLTYTRYASEDEQRQIDRLCSRLGFYELRLTRVTNR
jgi:hypothetical protein